MTESKKYYSTVMVHEATVKGKDNNYHHIQTVMYVEGRITKAGVTSDDKKANLAISIQNQTKALNRALKSIEAPEGSLFHSESNGNEYDLLHAVCWNKYSKERLGKVPAGSVVGLFGDLRKNVGTDGKTYVALYIDDFKVIKWADNNKSADADSGSDETAEEPAEETTEEAQGGDGTASEKDPFWG